MKRFDLPAGTRLKLTKTTPRKETHGGGKELVQAISLRLEWHPVENSALNLLDDGLQDLLFWTPPEVAAQCALDGIAPVKKHLRSDKVQQPLKLPTCSLTGYTLLIEHGIDESTALELYSCALDKFEVEAKQGGSSTIRWSLASNKEITPDLVGALCDIEGSEIVVQLSGPTEGEVIDGTVGHPGLAAQQAAEAAGQQRLDGEQTPEKALAEAAGRGPDDETEDDDRGDGEGSDPDVGAGQASKAALDASGNNPFGTAPGGSATDAFIAANRLGSDPSETKPASSETNPAASGTNGTGGGTQGRRARRGAAAVGAVE